MDHYIRANPVHTTEQYYDNATNEVHMNNSTGEWFRTVQRLQKGKDALSHPPSSTSFSNEL